MDVFSQRGRALRVGALLLSAALGVAATLHFAPRLPSDSSIAGSSLLDQADEARFQDFQRYFGADEVLLITLRDAGERPIFRPETLRFLRDLGASLKREPTVADVVSLASLEDFSVRSLFGQSMPTPPRLLIPANGIVTPAAEADLRRDPFLATGILSDDGRTTALWVLLRPELRDEPDYLQKVASLAALVHRAPASDANVRLAVTGFPLLRHALRDAFLAHGLAVGGLALLMVLGVAFALGVRVAALIAFALGIATLVGLLVLLAVVCGRSLHLYSPNLVPLLIATGSGLLLHVGTRDGRAEVRRAVWRVAAWSALTTAIGFACLAPSRLPALSAFGIEAAVSSVLAFSVLSAALWLMPGALAGRRRRIGVPRLGRRLRVALGVALLVASLPWFAFDPARLGSVGDLAGYLPTDHRLAVDTRSAREAMQALLGVEIVMELPVDGPDGPLVLDSDFLLGIEAFEAEVKATAGEAMPRLFGAGAMLRYLGTRMDRPKDAAWEIDAEVVAFARRWLLEPFVKAGMSGRSDSALVQALRPRLGQILSEDGRRLRWHARIRDPSPAQISALERNLGSVIDKKARELGATGAWVTGSAVAFAKTTEAVLATQVDSLSYGAIGLAIFLLIVLRSLWLGLLSIAVSALTIVATINGLFVWEADLNLYTAVLTATLLGVVVDDTLHLIAAFQHARGSPKWRAALAYRRAGPPVWASSAALAAAFLAFAASPLPFYRQFAATGIAFVALALLVDFVLLLPLLRRWPRARQRPHADA